MKLFDKVYQELDAVEQEIRNDVKCEINDKIGTNEKIMQKGAELFRELGGMGNPHARVVSALMRRLQKYDELLK